MTENEAKMAFETKEMLIIPPQIVLPDISFELKDYKGSKKSKLNRYISKDVKPLNKNRVYFTV